MKFIGGHIKRFMQKRGHSGSRGATAVEFALVAPIFLLFVLGIIDLGRLFFVKNLMQYATEQTARYAMVNPTATNIQLETYADDEIASLFTGVTFNADTETIDGVEFITITASYTFNYVMPFITLGDVPLSAKSRTPVNEE